MDWTGQVAIVTGASRGIGRAIARRLARCGAAICVNYATREDEAEAASQRLLGPAGAPSQCKQTWPMPTRSRAWSPARQPSWGLSASW